MNDDVMSPDEIRCLRMWFRQAIAQVEQQEVTSAIAAEKKLAQVPGKGHRHSAIRRRSRVNRAAPHLKELVF
ncbi:MAG: hypothetical protein K8F91_19930 [Candidatus Obscuribacterales bacterium]|nr:hypothetical protein [Candidatus Obscuribacterales bacterium]